MGQNKKAVGNDRSQKASKRCKVRERGFKNAFGRYVGFFLWSAAGWFVLLYRAERMFGLGVDLDWDWRYRATAFGRSVDAPERAVVGGAFLVVSSRSG